MVLESTSTWSRDIIVLRPEALDKDFPMYGVDAIEDDMGTMKDKINSRLLVAALVATVTFAAGFTVPGGYNGSDMASKNDRGMATMLDKRMFQAFAICNAIAMICSMIAVVNLMLAQQTDAHKAEAAYLISRGPLTISLLAMSVAFLTGVTLTVGELPWLAHTIFLFRTLFPPHQLRCPYVRGYPYYFQLDRLRIRRLSFWLVLASMYWWDFGTMLLDHSEEDGAASQTSVSRPQDGAGESNP